MVAHNLNEPATPDDVDAGTFFYADYVNGEDRICCSLCSGETYMVCLKYVGASRFIVCERHCLAFQVDGEAVPLPEYRLLNIQGQIARDLLDVARQATA